MTYDPISKPKPIQINESLKKGDYLPYDPPPPTRLRLKN